MIKLSFIPSVAILAIFSILTISCEETQTPEQMQLATRHLSDKEYEEQKEEARQFIKAMQDEREEAIEKKMGETEKQKEHHIIHKKDSTSKKDVDNRLENHTPPIHQH